MRMLAPAEPRRFRSWLQSLPDETLRSEYLAVTAPLVAQTIPDDRILEPQDRLHQRAKRCHAGGLADIWPTIDNATSQRIT